MLGPKYPDRSALLPKASCTRISRIHPAPSLGPSAPILGPKNPNRQYLLPIFLNTKISKCQPAIWYFRLGLQAHVLILPCPAADEPEYEDSGGSAPSSRCQALLPGPMYLDCPAPLPQTLDTRTGNCQPPALHLRLRRGTKTHVLGSSLQALNNAEIKIWGCRHPAWVLKPKDICSGTETSQFTASSREYHDLWMPAPSFGS